MTSLITIRVGHRDGLWTGAHKGILATAARGRVEERASGHVDHEAMVAIIVVVVVVVVVIVGFDRTRVDAVNSIVEAEGVSQRRDCGDA